MCSFIPQFERLANVNHKHPTFIIGEFKKTIFKKKRKHFPGFRIIMSYRSTTGSLGEQEILWEHIKPLASVSTAHLQMWPRIFTWDY